LLTSRSWRGASPSPLRLGPAAQTQVSLLSPEGERAEKSVPALRRLHNLGQHPAHILRLEEDDHSPLRSYPWATEQAFHHRLELALGGVDVGHFLAHLILP